MKATMIRKASSVADWYSRVAEIEKRDKESLEQDECIIEKTIVLSKGEFNALAKRLLADSKLIAANLESMYVDENGVWHCIEVTHAKSDLSILIEGEGYSYARYTAIIQKGGENK